MTFGDLRELERRDPRAILMLVHRLRMGELDRETTLALADALDEPDLASEDVETVEAAIACMNARVRTRRPQDFKRELHEAAARMASRVRARPTAPVARPAPRRQGQPRARTPRARRVTRSRSPASDDPSSESDPPLDLLDVAVLAAGWERVG